MPIVKLLELKCERCLHVWAPRKADVRLCPHCHSAWWDRPQDRNWKSAITTKGGK